MKSIQRGIECLEEGKKKSKWHRDELREYNKEDAMRPNRQEAISFPKTEESRSFTGPCAQQRT